MSVAHFHGISALLPGEDMPVVTVTHVSEHLLPMSPVYTPLPGEREEMEDNFGKCSKIPG
jgi:hypothetical protein